MTLPTLEEPTLRGKLTYADGIDAVTRAFTAMANENVVMPPIQQLLFPDRNGSTCVKSAGITGMKHFTVKMASGFYDNASKTDNKIPNGSGIMVVFDAEYGFPAAIIQDNGWLTDLRTAGAGALAAQLCVRKNKRCKVAILGTGLQARMQLEAIATVMDVSGASFWGRTVANRDKLVDAMNSDGGLDFDLSKADSVGACVEGADIIICTTASTTPVLKATDVKKGATIIAMGSDTAGKSEVEGTFMETLVKEGRVICDLVEQCCRVGECQDIKEGGRGKLIELADVVVNRAQGRGSDDEIVLVDLTGVGAQDAAMSSLAIEKCG